MDVLVNDKGVDEATTRTGRKIRRPDRLAEQYTVALLYIEYGTMLGLLSGHEYAEGEIYAVGAGTTGWFENTKKLKVLKFDEAVNGTEKSQWLKAVGEEFVRFQKNSCLEPVERIKVKPACTMMTSTWAMKKKS